MVEFEIHGYQIRYRRRDGRRSPWINSQDDKYLKYLRSMYKSVIS